METQPEDYIDIEMIKQAEAKKSKSVNKPISSKKNVSDFTDDYIKIFNPKDIPYGKLSNNAFTLFELDRKVWKSVNHYIYSNLLKFSTSKSLLERTKSKEVYETFEKLYQEEKLIVIIKALNEAHLVKFNMELNPELNELLLSTEGLDIVYRSNNLILGINGDNEGYNAVGKSLVKTREILATQKKKYEKEKYASFLEARIYNIYKAYAVLENMLSKGYDPVELENMSPEELLINVYSSQKYAKFRVDNIPDVKTLVGLYEKEKLPWVTEEILNPGNLVKKFRIDNITQINDNIKNMYYDVVLDVFLTDILNTEYNIENDKYEEAKKEQLSRLESYQLDQLRKRLYFLYKNKSFDKEILSVMERRMRTLPAIISKEYIDRVKEDFSKNIGMDIFEDKESLESLIEDNEKANKEKYGKENIDIPIENKLSYFEAIESNILKDIKIMSKRPKISEKSEIQITPESKYLDISELEMSSKFYPLNPGFTEPQKGYEIFAKIYPNVLYYILICLFAHIKGIDSMDRAYDYLIEQGQLSAQFRPYENLKRIYDIEQEKYYVENVEYFCKTGMDKKFMDRYLHNLLVSTGTRELLYTSNDKLLGTGRDNSGFNLVGKYLQYLRGIFNKEDKNVDKVVPLKDVAFLPVDIPYFKSWLDTRVKDICSVYNILTQYIEFKLGVNINKKPYIFLREIFNTVYSNCGDVIYDERIVDDMPPNLVNMLNINCSISKDKQSLEFIWSYLYKLLYFLYISVDEPRTVDKLVYNLNMLKSFEINTYGEWGKSEYKPSIKTLDTDIFNAILIILMRLSKLIELYSDEWMINRLDISTAFDILTGVDIQVSEETLDNVLKREDIPDDRISYIIENIKNIDDKFSDENIAVYIAQMVEYIKSKNIINLNELLNRINFFL